METIIGRHSAFHSCVLLAQGMSLAGSRGVITCVKGCHYLCQGVSLPVSRGVMTCFKWCHYLCQGVSLPVSRGVITCVKGCHYLCQEVSLPVSRGVITFFKGCHYLCQEVSLPVSSLPGPRFNIKMSSYQYNKYHCGDKTIIRSSYLHNGVSYTGKITSLYWIKALCLSLPLSICLHLSGHYSS